MAKRNLFAEVKEGMDALAAEREAGDFSGPIKTESEYERAVMLLHALLDAGGADERHRLAPLVNRIGEFIIYYESRQGH